MLHPYPTLFTFLKDHREEILGEVDGNLEMLAQEPNVTSHVHGFSGKHSWRLVSCKWKVGLSDERSLEDPRPGMHLPGFQAVGILAAAANKGTQWRGCSPGCLKLVFPQIPAQNATASLPLSLMIPAINVGCSCRLTFQVSLYLHSTCREGQGGRVKTAEGEKGVSWH